MKAIGEEIPDGPESVGGVRKGGRGGEEEEG